MTQQGMYKGDCFIRAIETITKEPKLLFCFSYITIRYKDLSTGEIKEDKNVLHAWCEGIANKGGKVCIDLSNNMQVIIFKKYYYKEHKIDSNKVIRQNYLEVIECLKENNNICGSWCKEMLENKK